MTDKIRTVRQTVIAVFEKSSQRRYLEHTLRVAAFAESLGKSEGADLDVLRPAALVHDLGMNLDAGFPSHVEKSRLLGRWVLLDAGYTEASIHRILEVACSHHPVPGAELPGLEERVLFDADNMEIIGAYGILRWIGRLPDTSDDLRASIDVFLKLVDTCTNARGSLFYTNAARELGGGALAWTVSYFEQVKKYVAQFESGVSDVRPMITEE